MFRCCAASCVLLTNGLVKAFHRGTVDMVSADAHPSVRVTGHSLYAFRKSTAESDTLQFYIFSSREAEGPLTIHTAVTAEYHYNVPGAVLRTGENSVRIGDLGPELTTYHRGFYGSRDGVKRVGLPVP